MPTGSANDGKVYWIPNSYITAVVATIIFALATDTRKSMDCTWLGGKYKRVGGQYLVHSVVGCDAVWYGSSDLLRQ